MSFSPIVIHIGLNEEGAKILHEMLGTAAKKPDAKDEVLRMWMRLDGAMRRREGKK